MTENKPTALIAMSGGVDSSVAAALMVQRGYDCIGVTMKLRSNDDCACTEKSCCTASDAEDARSVAYSMGMKFYVFNFTQEFEQEVIGRFISAYEHGLTPNPCIDCNRYMKFELLYKRGRALGCEFIVTGHYARTGFLPEYGRWVLKKAKNAAKDQSYVLYSMSQEQLAHTIFPLGEFASKDEVRALADKLGLLNAHKHDSQDICFIPDGDYAEFIRMRTGRNFPHGDFLDVNGNVIGEHSGAIKYTIGQRKGLGISSSTPIFVKELRPQTNEVVLCKSERLFSRDCHVDNINYMAEEKLTGPVKAIGKIRYSHAGAPCTLYPQPDGTLLAQFDEPQRAMTPGQAAVFYQDDHVLCGGTIETK